MLIDICIPVGGTQIRDEVDDDEAESGNETFLSFPFTSARERSENFLLPGKKQEL